MGTSLTQLRSEITTELGGGVETGGVTVEVELTDAQFANVVTAAKRWFTAKKGYAIHRPIPIIEGQNDYKMKDDVAQVLDVIFQVPSDVAAFFSLGFFDIIPYGPNTLMSVGSGLTNYSGFAQLLEYTENRKKVFSVDPDYYYEPQTKILHITQRSASPFNIMLVKCKVSTFDPVMLTDKDDEIFTRSVKARCKQVVGRIRSKYDTLPGAGGPVALDGKDLIAEAKEEMEKLEIEIFASGGVDLPIQG